MRSLMRLLLGSVGVLALIAGIVLAGALPARATAATSKAPRPANVVVRPVTFLVRNANATGILCTTRPDGATYRVRGHLVRPRGSAGKADPDATLYLHGFGFSESFWRFRAVPGYNYAAQQAQAGQTSIVVDRLGYGRSDTPYGADLCFGSQATIAHQLVQDLRSGHYTLGDGGKPAPSFSKVALIGHSAGGFIAEEEAYAFHDIDALGVVGFSDAPISPQTALALVGQLVTCATGGKMQNGVPGYAYFGGRTPAAFRRLFFSAPADPAVDAATTAMRTRDPCGDAASALPSLLFDLLGDNQVRVPILLVYGAQDRLFPPPSGQLQKLLYLKPDVTMKTLPNTAHTYTLDCTAHTFRATVGDWLATHGIAPVAHRGPGPPTGDACR